MIAYVTGPLGAGKSYYGCRKIAEALLKGKAVLTNVQLSDNWEHIILSHTAYYRLSGSVRKREYRREMKERYAYVPAIEEIVGAMLHGRGQERGIRVIVEAHNDLNNREWAEGNQKKMLKVMALSRKRGWDDYIIAQHANNTDAALRRICTTEIRLVDWQQVTKLPVFQTKLLPFHCFLAQAYPTNLPQNVKRSSQPLWRELFFLSWQRRLYNTFQDYEAEVFDPGEYEGIILPVPGGYDYHAHIAVRNWGWAMAAQRRAASEEAAQGPHIEVPSGVTSLRTSRGRARRPLPPPRPSDALRTPTDRPRSATSESEA